MTLHMISFRPDFGRLVRLAHRERLLPSGDDLGYAVHAVFAATFGPLAPKPFVVLGPGEPGGGPAGRLLAYAEAPLDALVEQASAFADPGFAAPLCLDAAEAKAMPTRFGIDRRLGFRLRFRPTVRTGRPQENGAGETRGRARERDAFLAACEAAPEAVVDRSAVYRTWLGERFVAAGATLDDVALESFRRTRVLRRDRSGSTDRSRTVEGPDAVAVGTVTVTDPDRFAAALVRGIGRHRSFGFGMLLLTPPM